MRVIFIAVWHRYETTNMIDAVIACKTNSKSQYGDLAIYQDAIIKRI